MATQTELLDRWIQEMGTRLMHLAYFYVQDRSVAAQIARQTFAQAGPDLVALALAGDEVTLYRRAVALCRREQARPCGSVSNLLLDHIIQLPLSEREVAVLFYYAGLDERTVAAITGETEPAVQDCLERLRRQLSQFCAAN